MHNPGGHGFWETNNQDKRLFDLITSSHIYFSWILGHCKDKQISELTQSAR
jgi:hypothetical protein